MFKRYAVLVDSNGAKFAKYNETWRGVSDGGRGPAPFCMPNQDYLL